MRARNYGMEMYCVLLSAERTRAKSMGACNNRPIDVALCLLNIMQHLAADVVRRNIDERSGANFASKFCVDCSGLSLFHIITKIFIIRCLAVSA